MLWHDRYIRKDEILASRNDEATHLEDDMA